MSLLMTGRFWIELVVAAVSTVAFSVLFYVPRKYYPLNGFCGALGWAVYLILMKSGQTSVTATFVATLAVIFASRLLAVVERCPATLFLIPGIFPLIPGVTIYKTAYHVVTNDLGLALDTGFLAVKLVCVIVLAIIFIFEIPQSFFFKLVNFAKRS